MGQLGTNLPATQAFTRFGLGGRPADPIPSDAAQWLINQLSGVDPVIGTGPPLASSLNLVNNTIINHSNPTAEQAAQAAVHTQYANEVQNFLNIALTTATPFRERLVWFWTNHFALLTGSAMPPLATCGNFVREAIRPYINGRFSDMLVAVVEHPAMLTSLNNDQSVGPQSALAIQQGTNGGAPLGINENLARELMELYTIGLNGGYEQSDVDALAMILTGWTVSYTGQNKGFIYSGYAHQPGPQTLLGVTYPGSIADGYNALEFLATQPATYNFLATKLVTYFTNDTPDPADIATIQAVMQSTGGDLLQTSIALVNLPSAWSAQNNLQKLRTPMELVIAALRATGFTSEIGHAAAAAITTMGQEVWNSPFPNGYADRTDAWNGPNSMVLRMDWINTFAVNAGAASALTIAGSCLGPNLTQNTTNLINQQTGRHDQFTVLLNSPEFQRR